jgi:predicted metal-dependent phosphoesterase TrpH
VRSFAADLHIHTALSPCAAEEMTPPAIVARAIELGLAMIAVCDHNSAGNAAAVQEAAGDRLAALAGIEVTTAEEIHVLGLFPDAAAAEAVGREVQATLPARAREDRRLLSSGCGLGLSDTVDLIHRHGGLAVAAHVDRPTFSVVAQLGFFPQDAGFDAVEVSAAARRRLAASQIPDSRFQIPEGLPAVCGSDAHSLEELGAGRTVLEVEEPSFGELALALRGVGGRRCGCA